MSKYNEQHATTMLNALQGTDTLKQYAEQIRADERAKMLMPYDVESIDELIENVRANAFDECIEMLEHDCFVSGTASKVLIHQLEQLKAHK